MAWILILLMSLLIGCRPMRYDAVDAVYLDPVGYQTLLNCEAELVPDGREVLFCSKVERENW